MGVKPVEQYLSVSQLTKYISRKFEKDPYLERIYLKGEISNYNPRRRGSVEYSNISKKTIHYNLPPFICFAILNIKSLR